MGYLMQGSSPIADADSISLSLWFYAASADIANNSAILVDFGDANNGSEWPNFGTSQIFVSCGPDNDQIGMFIYGRDGECTTEVISSYPGSDITTPVGVDGDFNRTIIQASPNGAITGLNFLSAGFKFPPGFLQNRPIHFLLTIDLLNTVEYPTLVGGLYPYFAPTATLWVNGFPVAIAQMLEGFSGAIGAYTHCNGVSGTTWDAVLDGPDSTTYPNGNSVESKRGLVDNTTYSDATYAGPCNPVVPPSETPNFYLSINRWRMAIAGFGFGVPMQTSDVVGQPKIRMAYVQAWFDRVIDPAVHYSKFVSVSGTHGTPVDPSVPAATFGQQAILFSHGKSSFSTNRGSAGPFAKIGTVDGASSMGF